MRIVFFGTPDFAAESLRALIAAGHDVAAAVTRADKPQGRKMTLTPPPVKALAESRGILVLQPASLRGGDIAETLRSLGADLFVVVAYGRILPPEILSIPPLGCVNLHGSVLPKLRGAAPIQRAVIEGMRRTGVSTMYMAEGLDTGDVIAVRETDIAPDETAGELFDRLAVLGAELLAETVAQIAAGTAARTPQDDSQATFAPPLHKSEGEMDFCRPAAALCDQVRGMNPWPVAYTFLGARKIKVFKAAVVELDGEPGRLLSSDRLIIGCGDRRALELLDVLPEGRSRMTGENFLRGLRGGKG